MGKTKITPLDMISKRYGVVTTSNRINGSMILQVQLGDLSSLMENYAAAKIAELGLDLPKAAQPEPITADLSDKQAMEAPKPLPQKEVAQIPTPAPVKAPRKR